MAGDYDGAGISTVPAMAWERAREEAVREEAVRLRKPEAIAAGPVSEHYNPSADSKCSTLSTRLFQDRRGIDSDENSAYLF